ncbi:hypothetical protein F3I16_16080 [Pseudomonas sp. L-22-4S-12]|uniref:hypothetical protein n=1 Tax=Pseudomonas sp. L-22-4S-12 TaxID=2610893 RepID=UPI00132BA561|nr:hypothetical protein [Pseudomonas sp. L-22-4S-12]MWV17561.1 hypothetical protein [Pseudomonas sp. L-22-4S-12]
MNEQELIAAVKAAKTKDELEILVKEELGIDLDKRRKLEDLRSDILAGLGAGSESEQQEQDGAEHQEQGDRQEEQQQEEQGAEQQHDAPQDQTEPAPQEQAVPVVIVDSIQLPAEPPVSVGLDLAAVHDVQLPEIEGDDEDEQEEPVPRNRMLRNRENGREFVWTAELAKLAHMEEV